MLESYQSEMEKVDSQRQELRKEEDRLAKKKVETFKRAVSKTIDSAAKRLCTD